ncbi:hypothetical protein EVAR_44089_1 [Eumeta japonica]|uniref:Uncharacterized protein n=1 Tax=Eumeta variegata TaxID=151549 RepID=A0A4C1X2R9_EUMVA|nr:hypothetical protein EVAR_44089_1 [Eumeta japonica]
MYENQTKNSNAHASRLYKIRSLNKVSAAPAAPRRAMFSLQQRSLVYLRANAVRISPGRRRALREQQWAALPVKARACNAGGLRRRSSIKNILRGVIGRAPRAYSATSLRRHAATPRYGRAVCRGFCTYK